MVLEVASNGHENELRTRWSGGGTMNTIDLNNRHAVVTGAAQGMGFAVASRLLVSGASVSLWDLDGDALSTARGQPDQGARVSAETVDVSDASSVEAATESTLQKHGAIDVLVANAGIAGPNHTTWEYPIDTWKQVININLVGVFLCCRAVVPQMLRQGFGRIVNVASIACKEGNPNASSYSASKAGVIAITKSWARKRPSRTSL
jgi:2-dehydro-3-deoxy-L-rhamnonate dehydrogenase (NAD+)